MTLASASRCWPAVPPAERQQGQAMVYGLFVLLAAIAALFFLFNTGQLSREKTKLVNTSDAVAYSAGVMNARTLNYEAYINRAMVANTVAIAQLVSLSSWVQYVDRMGAFGGMVLDDPKYIHYYPAYFAAQASGGDLQEYLNNRGALEKLAKISDDIIRKLLMTAQKTAYAALVPARQAVMEEVAKANYDNGGTVIVDPIPLTSTDLPAFITHYDGDERTRLAGVVRTAVKKDGFVETRNWRLPALWSTRCFPAIDWLDRRGGTELVGLDEWKALDTLSEKAWHRTKHLTCATGENPAAWGTRTAADEPGAGFDPTLYGEAPAVNPEATGLAVDASSNAWDYSGLPGFYDLSPGALKDDDPRLRHAVRLRRPKDQTLTSEGRSEIRKSGSGSRLDQTLDAYQAQPAGGDDFVAVSASEVFFSRQGEAGDNVYGKSIGKPKEIASLFNPYWQVRLIQSEAAVQAAQALQGAPLP